MSGSHTFQETQITQAPDEDSFARGVATVRNRQRNTDRLDRLRIVGFIPTAGFFIGSGTTLERETAALTLALALAGPPTLDIFASCQIAEGDVGSHLFLFVAHMNTI